MNSILTPAMNSGQSTTVGMGHMHQRRRSVAMDVPDAGPAATATTDGPRNTPAIVVLVAFYAATLAVAIWAKTRIQEPDDDGSGNLYQFLLLKRRLGPLLGTATMTATWIGGGYVHATAESIYRYGLVWCHAPFGYACSLFVAGSFFAVKMREAEYQTMLDPFQEHFGPGMGALLFIPAFMGELFWMSAIFSALGATLHVSLGISHNKAILAPAFLIMFYTFTGGLCGVAYTDVLQLLATVIGLWAAVPFVVLDRNVGKVSYPANNWLGGVEAEYYAFYMDRVLMIALGGICWQVYFQRILASRTSEVSLVVSLASSFGCLFVAAPAVIIGVAAKAANFTQAGFQGPTPLRGEDAARVLPLSLLYLSPAIVSSVGLTGVSAAVMASADSSILSAASMFSQNVYKVLLRNQASLEEMNLVVRLAVVVVGIMATYISQAVGAVQGLWYLSSDMVYVVLFPQLVCVAYFRDFSNTYGSAAAYLLAITLRIGAGEKALSLPPLIQYPYYEEQTGRQLFPVRTFVMLASLLILLAVSHLSTWLFTARRVPLCYDVFGCFQLDDGLPSASLDDKKALSFKQTSSQPLHAASEASVTGTSAVFSSEDRAGGGPSEHLLTSLCTDWIATSPRQAVGQATLKAGDSGKSHVVLTANSEVPSAVSVVPQADWSPRSVPVASIGSLIPTCVPLVASKEAKEEPEEPKVHSKKKKRRRKAKSSSNAKWATACVQSDSHP